VRIHKGLIYLNMSPPN